MWRDKTLLITDNNLGFSASRLSQQYCSDLKWVCWDRREPENKHRLLNEIAREQWQLVISFYSDLLIPADLLERMRVPLNIHPALPRIRGVGYDTIPLVEGHEVHGVTLHRMDEAIDAGEIYWVAESPVAADLTQTQLRKRNQLLCLRMLRSLLRQIRLCRSVELLEAYLQEQAGRVLHRWGDVYVSRSDLDHRLEQLRLAHPDHPVFK